jgi:hypothetical protein
MMAPHSLALHGNLAGAWGRWLPLGLTTAAGVYLPLVAARGHRPPEKRSLANEAALYQRVWGGIAALAIPLSGRLVSALAGATGILVTAGFAFNETFLYWFPNFAFAYLLLGALVALQFCGHRVVQSFQILFMVIALGGLLMLTFIALAGSGAHSHGTGNVGPAVAIRSWPPILLLFVGVDLALLSGPTPEGEARNLMIFGLLGATFLFALWGWATVGYLPLQRLRDTTIAPVLVAKQVWGQPGRYTMGAVTIAGTLAAVNALFSMVAATINGALRQLSNGHVRVPPAAVVTLLGMTTAAMMALGMAGTEGIDVALRAGLVLWLLHYALVPLLSQINAPKRPLAILAGSAMLAGAGTLVFVDPNRGLVLIFMLAGLAAATFMAGGVWLWLQRRWANY